MKRKNTVKEYLDALAWYLKQSVTESLNKPLTEKQLRHIGKSYKDALMKLHGKQVPVHVSRDKKDPTKCHIEIKFPEMKCKEVNFVAE